MTPRFKHAPSNQPAAWIFPKLSASAFIVNALVPSGFGAYVRVLHPAEKEIEGVSKEVRWQEVAKAEHTKVHPLMQWPKVSKVDPHEYQEPLATANWSLTPDEGHLKARLAEILVTLLKPATTTPQHCWFAIWEGHGGIYTNPFMTAAPKFTLYNQNYFLFQGPIALAAASFLDEVEFPQSANMWWPEDKSWFVATDIDLMSTYIGAARNVADKILADPGLEPFEVALTDGVARTSDTLN